MHTITTSKLYAVLMGTLGILGLFVNGHLFKLTNTDMVLDIFRIGLAGYLVYAAFIAKSEKIAASGLLATGALYVAISIWGVFSATLGGMLPSGLTGFDIIFHLMAGAAAVIAGMRYDKAYRRAMMHA
jgi:hypothetical protein